MSVGTNRVRWTGICALSVVLATSCIGDIADPELDVASLDEANERMRRRMNIRITRGEGDTFEERELTPDELVGAFEERCDELIGRACLDVGGDVCDALHCGSERSLCIANEFLNLTTDTVETIDLEVDGVLGTWDLPAQSVGAKAALTQAALDAAGSGADSAYQLLLLSYVYRQSPPPPSLRRCAQNPIVEGGVRRDEAAATLHRALLDVAFEAAEQTNRWSLALADGQHSDRPNIDESARDALLLSAGSRSSAARAWVDGEPGLDAINEVSESGFCPEPRLSPEARRALELFRLSGLPPARVLDFDIPLADLVEQDVLPRLALLLGAPHLDAPPPDSISLDEFLEGFGLGRAAVLEARTMLAGEIRAHGRSLTALVPEDSVPALEGLDYHAATATAPPPPLASYWAAVARYRKRFATTTIPDFGSAASENSVSSITAGVVGQSRLLAHLVNADGSEAWERHVQEVFATTYGDNAALRSGLARVCVGNSADPTLQVRFDSDVPGQTVRVVLGHDGLQCAVRGSVDGAPCDLDQHMLPGALVERDNGLLSPYAHRYAANFADGVGSERFEHAADNPLYANDERFVLPFFLVAEQSGDGPGAYREISGTFVHVPKPFAASSARYICDEFAIVPEADQRVLEALAPSTGYCGASAQSCAGIPIDQRLPLENELISDGDAFESSWRHYLNLAQTSAEHADRLGEDLIRAGLEMDVRAEQAIDELEELCGVSINVSDIGAMVPPGSDPVEYAMTMVDDADQARLAACLGDSATVPWVTLGDQPICFTHDGTPQSFCEGVDGCPSPTSGACPTDWVKAEALGFFTLTEEGAADMAQDQTVDPPPCEQIAALGNLPTEAARISATDAILAHPMFELDNLQRLARQLGWEAYPGDYSTVTLDGSNWLSTGNYLAEPGAGEPAWPCGASPASYDCDVTNGGLFCEQLGDACPGAGADPYLNSNRYERARMNDRLARAVLAAKIIAGVELNDIRVPYYPRTNTPKLQYTDGDSDPNVEPWPAHFPEVMTRNHGSTTDNLFVSPSAVLRMDKNGDFAGPVDLALFEMGRGRAYSVRTLTTGSCAPGGHNRGIEWTLFPWHLSGDTPVERFDDAIDDCDDNNPDGSADPLFYDRDLPMVVRTINGDAALGNDVTNALSALWVLEEDRDSYSFTKLVRSVLYGEEISFGPNTEDIDALTGYWRRTTTTTMGMHGALDALFLELTGRCFSNLVLPGGGGDLGCQDVVGCQGYYPDCQANAGEDFDFDVTFDGNRAFIASDGLDHKDVLAGLEMLCAAAEETSDGTGSDCTSMPEIHSVGDLFAAQGYFECQADSVRNNAAGMILRDLPRQVVTLLGSGGTSGTTGAGVSGEIAAATDELRAALIELSDSSTQIGATVDSLGAAVGGLRSRSQQMSIKAEIGRWQLASTVLNQVTSCVSKVSEAAGGMNAGAGVSAGAVCANSAAQIGIAASMTTLNEDLDEAVLRESLYRFEQEFNGAVAALSGADTRLRASVARIEAAITRIKNLQRRGRRALAKALMLDSDPGTAGEEGAMGRRFYVNTVMRRRMNTLRARYEEAHRNAVRTAFLAKIALEQRLGMAMDQMTDPLTLVDEPPAGWHMDVCSMSGIDYDRIRDTTVPPGGAEAPAEGVDAPEDYAGEYIGDYVRRLALVYESYSIDFPFQDGTDTTVLSLRDEIWQTRAPCSVGTPNLLYEAGQLDQIGGDTRYGWEVEGCGIYEDWKEEDLGPQPACVSATPIREDTGVFGRLVSGTDVLPIPVTSTESGAVPMYDLRFGVENPPMDGTLELQTRTRDTHVVQWTDEVLPVGRYRLSYFERTPSRRRGDPDFTPEVRVLARRSIFDAVTGTYTHDSTPIALETPVPSPIERRANWQRRYFFVDLESPTRVGISIRPRRPMDGFQRVQVGALMFEDVTSTVVGSLSEIVSDSPRLTRANASPPPLFFNTTQTRDRVQTVCTDTDGSVFRDNAWTRHCVGLCPDGYGDCPGALQQHCYYETSFTLDPERLQRQGVLDGAGFAFGNFNYRVEQVALNVVGTNVRDCEAGGGGATCYASGNVSYSIVHDGPYPVRNHGGGLYDAPLFRGRVERARALAAERYLSNPMSGTDRSLIEPYLRRELVGRPLSGTYSVRIWDDLALAWSNIEDVQLMLKYRYWTRQE